MKTTIYIYNAAQYESLIRCEIDRSLVEIVDQHTATDNHDCEEWARANNYDDPDCYAWSYTDWTKK